jgi:hypothetical protein
MPRAGQMQRSLQAAAERHRQMQLRVCKLRQEMGQQQPAKLSPHQAAQATIRNRRCRRRQLLRNHTAVKLQASRAAPCRTTPTALYAGSLQLLTRHMARLAHAAMVGHGKSQSRTKGSRTCLAATGSSARGWRKCAKQPNWQTALWQMLPPPTQRLALLPRRRLRWQLPPLRAWCCQTAGASRTAAPAQQQLTTAMRTARVQGSGQCSDCQTSPPGMQRRWTGNEAAATVRRPHRSPTTRAGTSPAAQPARRTSGCGETAAATSCATAAPVE